MAPQTYAAPTGFASAPSMIAMPSAPVSYGYTTATTTTPTATPAAKTATPAAKKDAKAAKTAKKAKKKGGPKKPLSGFMLFSKENRAKVKEENPDITFGGIGKKLGEMWRALSDKEKAKYKK